MQLTIRKNDKTKSENNFFVAFCLTYFSIWQVVEGIPQVSKYVLIFITYLMHYDKHTKILHIAVCRHCP